LPAEVPPGLAELVGALLAKDPANRPGDAAAIAAQAQRMVRARSDSLAPEDAGSGDAYPSEPTQAVVASGASAPMTSVLAGSRRRGWPDVLTAGRRHSTSLAVGVLVAVVVAATLLATRMLTTGPSRHTAGSSAAPSSSLSAKPLAVTGATLFGSGDHPEELPNVTDSSSSTAWYTEHYASAAFGGLKSGVGLRLQTSSAVAVKTVVIRFADPGIAASLYAGTSAVSQGQSKPLATTSSAPVEWRITLPAPVHAQTWMIWITHLVPDSGGYRAGVANVAFYG
jgi:hypothetical protein